MIKKKIIEWGIYEDGELIDVLFMTEKDAKKYQKDNQSLTVIQLEDDNLDDG